jgi:hypothetical protein
MRLLLHTLLVSLLLLAPVSLADAPFPLLSRRNANASSPTPPARVLACLWGLDRASDATWPSFQRYVLNVLDADLCASVSDKGAPASPSWRGAAAFLDVYPEPASFDHLISPEAQAAADDTGSGKRPHETFLRPTGVQQMYSRFRLWERVIQPHGLTSQYEWFLFLRSDLLWLAPVFDPRAAGFAGGSVPVWVPFAGARTEARHGFYDRTAFVHSSQVEAVLTMLEAVKPNGTHSAFLQALVGSNGGRSVDFRSFSKQYLAWLNLPIRRFNFTAFTTLPHALTLNRSAAVLSGGGVSETGHAYKYTDEFTFALATSLRYYRDIQQPLESNSFASGADGMALSSTEEDEAVLIDRRAVDSSGRRFFVITIEQAERVNASLSGCGLSAWGVAVYQRLLSHPLRTKHVRRASAVFLAPHFAWDYHWPTPNGNREGNSARKDAHFPLPMEGAAYEPYGMRLATSCRSAFSPCGYEGCFPGFGAVALEMLTNEGKVFSPCAVVDVLHQMTVYFQLSPSQKLVYYDSGPPGPVAYKSLNPTPPGGFDLPPETYADPRFLFATANAVPPFFRPHADVSLPTPWTEDVKKFLVRRASGAGGRPAYFLTFKGNFATSGNASGGGDVRRRAALALHSPAAGVIVVDSESDRGKRFDYRQLMYDTVFALIIRGDQPYSYRFTETVCSGSVPVLLLSNGWTPPFHNLQPFESYGVLVDESELNGLLARLRGMGEARVEALRVAARQFCLQRLINVHAQADSLVDAALAQVVRGG